MKKTNWTRKKQTAKDKREKKAKIKLLALHKEGKRKLVVLEVDGGPEPPKEVNSWTELGHWFKRLWDDLPTTNKGKP